MKRCAGVFYKTLGRDCLAIIPEQYYLLPEHVDVMPEPEARQYALRLQESIPSELKIYVTAELGYDVLVDVGTYHDISLSLPHNIDHLDKQIAKLSPGKKEPYSLSNLHIEIPPLTTTAKEMLRLQQLDDVDIDGVVDMAIEIVEVLACLDC